MKRKIIKRHKQSVREGVIGTETHAPPLWWMEQKIKKAFPDPVDGLEYIRDMILEFSV